MRHKHTVQKDARKSDETMTLYLVDVLLLVCYVSSERVLCITIDTKKEGKESR